MVKLVLSDPIMLDPSKCPHFIMVPEHYTPEGCRCTDKAHVEMREWGYRWRKGAWR
jgi:hypothetical protein